MSIVTTCDHCKQTIRDDVAYLLTAVRADNPALTLHTIVGPAHLHWECVPLFDRTEDEDAS